MQTAENPLVCTKCRASLRQNSTKLACTSCRSEFPLDEGIADFSGGNYYDQFSGNEEDLGESQLCGLCNEDTGVESRIEDFYLPLIQRFETSSQRDFVRVLDSGCGNGKSVELLDAPGVEAWGNDLSALRKWQWRDLSAKNRLVVADTRQLPFPDGFFDVVLSSGVLEHIGVDEIGGDTYSVTPRASRDEERLTFLRELLRVMHPDGVMYLDFPNGRFPIDFWHGTVPGGARFHSPSEGFLPTTGEIRGYLRTLGAYDLRPHSPRNRLRMRQVGQHWWGRLLRAPMQGFLRAMDLPGLQFLAASPFNPYLVLEVRSTG